MRFTQVEAAKKLDWSQGAISHYLCNLTQLGPAAIVKFADFLGVDPTEIDPDIESKLPFGPIINVTYQSNDMTLRTDDVLYAKQPSASTYVRLSEGAHIENSEPGSLLGSSDMNTIAQIDGAAKHPSAKVFAVRLKKEKKLRFYHKNDLPPHNEIYKKWAVISFFCI